MKIAQVSPLCESVPPKCYGGTERVVSYLTEALVDLGHEVTLFASGDSETRAQLVPVCSRALRSDESVLDPVAHHILLAEKVMARSAEFDLIHWHIDYLHFSLARRHGPAHLTTLHGRLDLPHLGPIFDEFRDVPVNSISDAQRRPLPQARWAGTVYHGLPPGLYQPGAGDGGYFVFLGRISPEKRVDRAVSIATRLGVPLIVAAKIDRVDHEYFRSQVAPLFEHPLVDFIGEVDEPRKRELLCGARALLFPIDWPEPFGLVMIEAMACGTPVVAYRCGSVPEVMTHGVTGFVVDADEQAVIAAARTDQLDRAQIRRVFEQRFTARSMAERYLEIYAELASARPRAARVVAA
jgi:glycosyltransferase involved in cell wall biosynthesis